VITVVIVPPLKIKSVKSVAGRKVKKNLFQKVPSYTCIKPFLIVEKTIPSIGAISEEITFVSPIEAAVNP
jgi:hypothetical protein